MYGLEQVAIATVVSEVVVFTLLAPLLYRTTGISFRHVLSATGRSTVVTVCSVAGPLLIMLFAGATAYPVVVVIAGSLAALVGWLAGIFWCRHPIGEHVLQGRVWLSARILSRS
jgi:hypothetical protein